MSTRVYVGGLSNRCREKDLERFFRKFGRQRDISIKNGYAFVEFDDYRDADDACYELSGKDLMGERITIELARGTPHGRDKEKWGYSGGRRSRSKDRGRDRDRGDSRGDRGDRGKRPVWMDKYGPPTRTEYRVTIENLSSRVSWQDLKDFMRQAGDVTYADAHKLVKNQGTVEFASYDDMQTAIEKLDDTELNGRRITIVAEKNSAPKTRRSRTRSKSRSRSRSRSRRRTRSRSHSGRRDKSKSKSGSRSKSRSKTRSRTKSRSRSRSRSKFKSKSSIKKERSRSNSPKRTGNGSDEPNDD